MADEVVEGLKTKFGDAIKDVYETVSYTHLTLPTKA